MSEVEIAFSTDKWRAVVDGYKQKNFEVIRLENMEIEYRNVGVGPNHSTNGLTLNYHLGTDLRV